MRELELLIYERMVQKMNNSQKEILKELYSVLSKIYYEAEDDEGFNEVLAELNIFAVSIDEAMAELRYLLDRC